MNTLKTLLLTLIFVLSITFSAGLMGQGNHYEAEGDHAYDNGKYNAAIDFYNKEIATNDTNGYNFYRRGRSKNYTKDYAGAIADFTKAIALSPTDKDQMWAYGARSIKIPNGYSTSPIGISFDMYYFAYFYRGKAKIALDDYRGALADFSKIITITKNLAGAYHNRAICKAHLGKTEEAIQDYSKSIELNPNEGLSYYNRAICYIIQGQKEKGCMDLSKAGELGIAKAYDGIKKSCN